MKIQLRNDTTSNWELHNPILAPGEVGVDITLGKLKVGNGTSTWSQLDYIGSVDLSGYATTTQLENETTARQLADNNLQGQIDAITASSDVTDIVGTYAELQAYDTSSLTDGDIVKVLQDEAHSGEATYYRWIITGGVGAWNLIGEEGPYYTKLQADTKFVDLTSQQEITGYKRFNNGLQSPSINSPGTSRNVIKRDMIGPDIYSITIGDSAKTTGVYIERGDGQTYTNIDTGNLSSNLPTATTNNLGIVQPDGTTITINNGVISSNAISSLGYTPYNSTNPNGYQENVIETIKVNGTAQTVTNKEVDIAVPSAVTESTVLGWGFTKNTGTVTQVNNTSPDINGNVTLSIPTATSDLTNDSGYITSSALPTVNDATLTITQGGVTKGTFTANASSDVTIALDSGGGTVDQTYTSPLHYDAETKVLSLPYKAPISTDVTYTDASNILVDGSGYIALNNIAYSTSPASRQTCTFSGNTVSFTKETLTQVTTDGTGSWIVRDYTPEAGDVITITPYDYQTNQGRLGIILGKLTSGTFYPCFAVSYGYGRTNGYICPYSLKSDYTPEQAYSACSTGNSYNFGNTTYWDSPNMNASFSASNIRVTSDLQIRLLTNGSGIRPQLFAPTNNEPSGATGSTYYDLPDGINAIMFVGISASNSDTTIDTSTSAYVPYVLAGGVKDSNNNVKVDIRYASTTTPALALNYGNGLIVEDDTLKANLYSTTGSNTDGALTQEASTLLMKYSNIRLQGSLSLQNNILSGFGEMAFATLPKNFSPQSSSWEMVFNFKYVEDTSNNQTILDINDGFNITRPLTCYTNHNTGKLMYGLSSTVSNDTASYDILSETAGSHTLVDGTVYWLKFEFTGSAYNFYISTDGTTWESDLSVASSTAIYSGKPIVLGLYRTNAIAPLLGEIYLENCYININSERWWNGVEVVSNLDDIRDDGVTFAESPYQVFAWVMPSSTRYDLTIPASQSTVTATHDGWAVFVYRTATSGSFIGLANITRQIYSYASQPANNQLGRVYVPVRKNDTIRVEYTSSSTTTSANALYIMKALGGR